ncbi:trypsin-like peptidase domain-containing protein [Meiothermus sp. CFH 77666]|uniref:S1C family serine protease n=1 Tax=Meiothermus sp. CFH 77666 TaxID=2817942 RepID=UPI001AA04EE3|nr:trypsin-like peptidase domain-containing protein [Meiothermus sp. CFH 77666]MBO1437985.1 trypsin-like peptidase domain-containing protein [Meiothermus sp. CFH 77666]
MKSTVLKTSSLLAVAVLSGSALWFAFSHGQSSTAPSPVPSSLQGLLSDERNTVEIAQTASEGVVYISVRSNPAASLPDNLQPFAPFLQPQPQQGTGSGFVLDKQGHILTNYHVVQGASQITVRFKDSPKSYTAKVLGTAQPLDLAVIQVQAPAELLKPLALGDSDQVQVGEKTIAIGNPFGLDYSVSTGIVSAVRRNPGAVDALVPTLIQTDAAINPGNSGGPLLNSRAQVIGINTAIISPSGQFGNAQNAGVGFAIPINLAKQYLKQLEQGKNISDREILASRPRLGVSVVPLAAYNPQTLKANDLPEEGLMVQSVEKGSPAEKAGLKASTRFLQVQAPDGSVQQLGLNGDVIQEVNGTPIQDINDLRGVLEGAAGQPVTLKIWREGQSLTVTATPQLLASN